MKSSQALGRLGVRRALHLGAGIDGGGVVGVWNGDVLDRTAGLLFGGGHTQAECRAFGEDAVPLLADPSEGFGDHRPITAALR